MKIRVDRALCVGHALCAARAPEVYTLDDEGFCKSDGTPVAPHLEPQARLGARLCPEGAITLIEQETAPPTTPSNTLHKLTFIEHNGTGHALMAKPGQSLMEIAQDHNVQGIVGECGGCCSCATCHGYIDPAWLEHLPGASAEELELVSYAFDPLPNSRLTCQITFTPALEGLVVRLPKRQL